ncbi:MAG: energy transducer TonB [Pyrinomonadaceae bacterium]
MSKRIVLGFIVTLILCEICARNTPASVARIGGVAVDDKLEKEAMEYFQAVLDEDIGTISKYVHPKTVASFGNMEIVIGYLKLEFQAMKDEGLEPVSFAVVDSVSATEEDTPLSSVLNHTAVFRTSEGEAEFSGRMKVYTTSGKNYFLFSDTSIIKSFGIEEFDAPADVELNTDTADGQIIDNGVLNGSAIHLPAPKYPAAAKLGKITGEVSVGVVIDEKGKVISAKATSGDALLRPAAEKAALEATFQPTTLNGQAVMVSGVIIYNFTL